MHQIGSGLGGDNESKYQGRLDAVYAGKPALFLWMLLGQAQAKEQLAPLELSAILRLSHSCQDEL